MARHPSLPCSLALTGLLLVAAGCNGPPPEVVIDTRVSGQAQHDPRAEAQAFAETVADLGRRWWKGEFLASAQTAPLPSTAEDPAPFVLQYEPKPPTTVEAFTSQIQALREGPIDEIDIIARNLAEAGPQLWPEISTMLLDERERPKREYKQVLELIGGDVPNRYGHFALHWKKAHGHKVRVSEDWFEDLLALAPARISKLLRPVYRDAILTSALLRAAARISHEDPLLVDAIVPCLLDTAYAHEGTFRDEVGRSLDSIQAPAIAPLLRESVVPEDAEDGSVAERRAAYAVFSLDRMDRLHPSRALEAVAGDRRMLTQVLEAYGQVRAGEAAPLVLDLANSEAPQIRVAARQAFAAYVSGPLPKIRRKSIRLLNGQTSTQRAEISYREHARLAIRARLAEVAPEQLEPECDLWLSGGVIEPACERQPERLFALYLASLDKRREAHRHEVISRAMSHEDRVAGAAMLDGLLTDPSAPLDADLIAPFYAEVASLVEADGERTRAAQLLRKSAMLLAGTDPQRARELTVDALLLEAGGDTLDERGQHMLLTTARELDPEAPAVGAAITKLNARVEASSLGDRERLQTMVLVLLASLGLLTWAAGWMHRRRGVNTQPAPI